MAYDLLTQGFGPGYDGPLQLVAQAPTPDKAALAAAGDSQGLWR